MFLNLRRPNGRAEGYLISGTASFAPDFNFTQNRMLGNIGAPVEPHQWTDASGGFEDDENAEADSNTFDNEGGSTHVAAVVGDRPSFSYICLRQ